MTEQSYDCTHIEKYYMEHTHMENHLYHSPYSCLHLYGRNIYTHIHTYIQYTHTYIYTYIHMENYHMIIDTYIHTYTHTHTEHSYADNPKTIHAFDNPLKLSTTEDYHSIIPRLSFKQNNTYMENSQPYQSG